MKKFKNIAFILFVFAVFISCKKDKFYVYNGDAMLQFGPPIENLYKPIYDFMDTLKLHTFYYDPASVTEDTVFFDIYAIGGPKNTDRTFTLAQEQIPNAVNAESGKHYVAFNDSRATKNFVMKAGEVHTLVPIILLRDASLKTSTPQLKIVVAADQNFQLGERNKIWRRIEFTDRLSQPLIWATNTTIRNSFFGTYSTTKHAFMIEATGEKWDDAFFQAMLSDLSLATYWKTIVKTALIDYNNTHPPLTDEFGNPVTFPA